MPLQAHQQRVVDEHAELTSKLFKLHSFLDTPAFVELDDSEKLRLREQSSAMRVYANILSERIRAFPGVKAPPLLSLPTATPATMDVMVTRFLSWQLPRDFSPDAGIAFEPPNRSRAWPSGTNLLNALQTRAMLEYVTQG